jgi:hypothetical protein
VPAGGAGEDGYALAFPPLQPCCVAKDAEATAVGECAGDVLLFGSSRAAEERAALGRQCDRREE